MTIFKTEGIILQSSKFQDFDQILTLFTPEQGILRFLVKGSLNPKSGKAALTAPLSRAEFVYKKGRSELYSCREISMINSHLNLRENVHLLEAAFAILQAVRATQMAHKEAPDLYKLLLIYLEKLPLIADPSILSCSFLLKTLRHEGLLNFETPPFTSFNEEELQLFYLLATSRSFHELSTLSISFNPYQELRCVFQKLL